MHDSQILVRNLQKMNYLLIKTMDFKDVVEKSDCVMYNIVVRDYGL